MEKNVNMTTGRPMKLLLMFALPLMFGNIFQQLYTVVDTAIVGRGVGLPALAALGTVDWLNWMIISIAQGYTQGFSVRISQKYGQGDIPGLKKYIGQSARISIYVALASLVFAQLLLPAFLYILRVPEELLGMATLYMRIMISGVPVMVYFNYCSSVLRAVGDSKTPLYAMIAASVVNILLDLLAVFVLKWGIAGAAGATVFSQLVSGVICTVRMVKTPTLRFGKSDFAADRELRGDLIKIGTPMAARNVVVALGGIMMQSVVNTFGMSFIAGFTATNKMFGLLEIAAISYGYAVTTYVGQNFGASRPDRIKHGMHAALILCVVTSVSIAVLMFLFGRPITMLFISSDDPSLVTAAGNTAYQYLQVLSVFLPVLYMLQVHQAGLQGFGNTVIPMVSGMIELAVRIVASIVLGYTHWEFGIFLTEVSAWIAAGTFLVFNYYRCYRRYFPSDEVSRNDL